MKIIDWPIVNFFEKGSFRCWRN